MSGPWFDAMVRTSVQGSVLAVAVWLVCRLAGHRLDTRVRKALWWLVCLKIVIGMAWLSPPSLEVLPPSPIANSLPVLTGATKAFAEGAIGTKEQTLEATANWPSPIFLLWLVGVAIMTLRVARGTWRLRRTLALAEPDGGEDASIARRLAAEAGLRASPRLVTSDETTSPFAVGWWKPTIVLPSEFSHLETGERKMALAHEVAHLRHGDPALNVVPEIARILFFFLPPVWMACREWAAEREAVCDRDALDMTGAKPRDYREMLLKVASRDSRPMAAPALGATSEFGLLRRRLERIGRTTRFSALLGATAIAATVPALVPWQLAARPAKGEVTLDNQGFEKGGEKGPDGWTKGARLDGVKYLWDHEVKHSGNASLSIRKTAERYFPIAEWTQSRPVPAGAKSIEVSAWVKTAQAYKTVLDVQFVTDEGVASHEWVAYDGAKEYGDPPSNHDWRLEGGKVSIPPGTVEVIVALQDYGPGQVWFDDLRAQFSKEPPQAR